MEPKTCQKGPKVGSEHRTTFKTSHCVRTACALRAHCVHGIPTAVLHEIQRCVRIVLTMTPYTTEVVRLKQKECSYTRQLTSSAKMKCDDTGTIKPLINPENRPRAADSLGALTAQCRVTGISFRVIFSWHYWHRSKFPQFLGKKVGQTGTMARHNTQNGQNVAITTPPLNSAVHTRYNSACSTIIIQIARHGRRRIGPLRVKPCPCISRFSGRISSPAFEATSSSYISKRSDPGHNRTWTRVVTR